MLLLTSMVKKLLKNFMKKNYKSLIKKFRIVKAIKEKRDKCQMAKKTSQYIPKPYEALGGDINVKVNMSN